AAHPPAENREAQPERYQRREQDHPEQGHHRGPEWLPPAGNMPGTVEPHEIGYPGGSSVGELEVNGHHVAAQAEEYALAQGQHAPPAPRQADPDRDNPITDEPAQQR